jgi:hypothetical protein
LAAQSPKLFEQASIDAFPGVFVHFCLRDFRLGLQHLHYPLAAHDFPGEVVQLEYRTVAGGPFEDAVVDQLIHDVDQRFAWHVLHQAIRRESIVTAQTNAFCLGALQHVDDVLRAELLARASDA